MVVTQLFEIIWIVLSLETWKFEYWVRIPTDNKLFAGYLLIKINCSKTSWAAKNFNTME